MRGKLFILEGIEGCGKGTQKKMIEDRLRNEFHRVSSLDLYEPGSTPFADLLRTILKQKIDKPGQEVYANTLEQIKEYELSPISQAYLFFAAREAVYKDLVVPELEDGKVVFLDRSVDSTTAYQGWGQNPNLVDWIRYNNETIIQSTGAEIAKTFWIDVPAEVGLERAASRDQGLKDKFDEMGSVFFEKVKEGYYQEMIHYQELQGTWQRDRIVQIDGNRPPEEVHKDIYNVVKQELEK